jgi:hypothetical protein
MTFTSKYFICCAAISVFLNFFQTAPTFAEMRERDCGRFKILPQDVRDNTLYLLINSTWKLQQKKISIKNSGNSMFAYVLNDNRSLDGGMALIKSVDFYKGTVIKNKSVKLHRDEYKSSGGKSVREFTGNVGIDVYQNVHKNNKDIEGNLRKFHANDYIYKNGQTRSTRSSELRRQNFVFSEYDLIPKETTISFLKILFGVPDALAAPTPPKGASDGVESIQGFSAKLKYYGPVKTRDYDVVCFSLNPDDATIKTNITVRDFEYDGPQRDASPVGREQRWFVDWN